MAVKRVEAILKLRRDYDYNYEKVRDNFIPNKGEVCLVDTEKQGLCVVVGDGISTYGQLKDQGYTNSLFIICYFYNGKFYADENHTIALSGIENKFYIDKRNLNNVYYYLDGVFNKVGVDIPQATVDVAGIMKLYDNTGANVDGTMTQKAITNELNKKIEAKVDEDNETVIFD